MVFDPKVNRNSKDGIGDPADTAAVNSTDANTIIALLKGLYLLQATGSAAGATAALQTTGNASLATIASSVDGLETFAAALNGFVDGLETLDTAISGKLPATLGPKLMTTSLSVTFPSDQSPIVISGTKTIVAASSTITRPADTTAYASGDLVANSVTAGSVAALQFTTAARISGGTGNVVAARIQKSTNSVTNAALRLHLFDTVPTFTSAGDNSALSTVVVASAKGYIGYIDVTAMTGFSDVAWGTGAADNARNRLTFKATAQTLFGIIEARGAYTPGNAEVFTVAIMVEQD